MLWGCMLRDSIAAGNEIAVAPYPSSFVAENDHIETVTAAIFRSLILLGYLSMQGFMNIIIHDCFEI